MKHKTAIVIGGGLGGLSCALSLKGKGFDVTLYEKNSHLGGKLNYLEKDGFHFDLGPSIFTMPHIFEDLFRDVGENLHDWIKLVPLDPQWKNFFSDGSSFHLYQDRDRMRRELLDFSSSRDATGWFDYLAYTEKQLSLAEDGYLGHGVDGFWHLLRFYGLRRSFFGIDWHSSMSRKIQQYIEDPRLQNVLEYFIKYVGSSAINAPSMMGLLFAMQIRYGLWYIEGGLFELSRAMSKIAENVGVKIVLNTDIDKVIRSEGRAVGVETHSGTRDFAHAIVCNQEVAVAKQSLLGEIQPKRWETRKQTPSCSGLVIHLGTKAVYPQLCHHNFFYSANQTKHFKTVFDHGEIPEDPTLYVVAPARTDPSVCPDGTDNIKILPHIPPINEDAPLKASDYEKLRDRVLIKLECMGLADLRKNIIVEETWNPYDIRERYRSNGGSIYGVVCDRWKNQGIKASKKSSDCEGLYFVGGSVNPGSGMPMVVLGGRQTARLISENEL